MYLILINGEGIITIGENTTKMELHKQLFIPQNTSYKISNVSNIEKLIFITLL